ncbi:hypothetical protein LSCM1_06466 [Leishmania martiniquensis]|uniref:Uncharacterized protein n=1 Tax=Leishmania martiniquensis TaxID=1580590 RepID=A0A836GTV4_9TRYP|nr:hypothetical protein LSCM1_06466 [Leishmania martiniquensis]
MGAGSSTGGTGDTGAQLPPCPLFYNFMPNTQLIPASTLPKRDPSGSLRRPKGGCAARVIPLRSLPIVSGELKKHAKKIAADAKNKKRDGDSAAGGAEANAVAAATALLNSPSLLPSLSSCFLINIAVDERGRLAPLPTEGGHATVTVAADQGDAASGSRSPSWSLLTSPQSSFVKKGFSFSCPNTPSRTPLLPGVGGGLGGSFANGARRLLQDADKREATNELGSPPVTASASSITAGSRPAGETQLMRHNLTKAGADAGTRSALSGAPERPPTSFAVPLPSRAGLAKAVIGTTWDGEHDMLSATASVCSVLVKDSRFRKPEDGPGRANSSVAPAYPSNGANGGDNACPPRMRRQLSRITLFHVPQRTRWFLFNDSNNHEAHVSVLLCYHAQEQLSGPKASLAGEKAPADLPGRTPTTWAPTPGDLRIMCRATPLLHTSVTRRRQKVPLESACSSNRTYVEVRPVSAEAFIDAIPPPKTAVQEGQLAGLEKQVASAAAVEVFVVLAPGATVYLAEGEVLGYRIDTHLIPFDQSSSMAVLGSTLTLELARSLKKKGGASKKGYHHTLIFLAEAAAPPVSTGPACTLDSAAAALTSSAVPTLPSVTAGRALKGDDSILPSSTKTLNNVPLSSRGPAASVAPPKALANTAGRADHASVAASVTLAVSLQQRLSSSAPRCETIGEGAAAGDFDKVDARRHLSSQRSAGTAEGSRRGENYGTEATVNFCRCGALKTAPCTTAAALPTEDYPYRYDFANDAATRESAVAPLVWSAEYATPARADEMEKTAGAAQLPVLVPKRLVDDSGKDRSIPRGDVPSALDHSYSTSASHLDISF